MQVTIQPTPNFFMAGEVMVRMWQGQAEDGTEVVALVAAVAVAGDVPAVAQALVSIPPPAPDDAERWAAEVFRRAGRSG